MNITDLKTKQVAVLGFGEKEGRATLEHLLRHGVRPTLFDKRVWEDFPPETQSYIKEKNVPFVFGPEYLDELRSFEVAFRNPAVPFLLPQLQKQIKRGLIVTSQTKWFFEHCPAKIIGVTGTKGKGTTASLIFEILKTQCQISAAKYQIHLTGNIGKEQPFEFLDNLTPEDWVVSELSSFQLQDLHASPHIAVVLMTTSEHLDYHLSLEEYHEGKTALTKFQNNDNYAVINADFPVSVKTGKLGQAKKKYFSTKGKESTDCYVENGLVHLKFKDAAAPEPLVSVDTLQLRGSHNWQNVCAAVLAASLVPEMTVNAIKSAVVSFPGLEHRLEFVAEKNTIKFYNDSFSTVPETAIAAIQAFSEPLILILGGSSKSSDFTELAETIRQAKNIKAIILIGQEAEKIKQAIGSIGRIKILEGAKSIAEIFTQVKQEAGPGDVVLLSPACASFGMFKNYRDRGEQFKTYVISFE